jgi:hypothetical protein
LARAAAISTRSALVAAASHHPAQARAAARLQTDASRCDEMNNARKLATPLFRIGGQGRLEAQHPAPGQLSAEQFNTFAR